MASASKCKPRSFCLREMTCVMSCTDCSKGPRFVRPAPGSILLDEKLCTTLPVMCGWASDRDWKMTSKNREKHTIETIQQLKCTKQVPQWLT